MHGKAEPSVGRMAMMEPGRELGEVKRGIGFVPRATSVTL